MPNDSLERKWSLHLVAPSDVSRSSASSGEHADIVLIDTHDDYRVIPIEKTLAWNLQQGTMMYWNPKSAETQFFFNDRDPDTNKIFTVIYDIQQRKRLREYRFEDTPIANGGVAQNGDYFIAINYGRIARLRPVTGYPSAFDWTVGQDRPPMTDYCAWILSRVKRRSGVLPTVGRSAASRA